ncbi:TolC family protein [Paraflavisolibacter sp. H34]|uniref:TolC family protein n=1 Tax=Huijunlia imazamoxiresistens TaxID=3127457 RepID=UPI0030197878
MKHRISGTGVLAVLVLLCSALTAGAQEKKSLTLNEAVELGVRNSKQLKGSQARIEEATAALKEAVERKLPDASASASYMRLNSPNVDVKLKTGNSSSGSSGGSGGSSSDDAARISQLAYGMVNASLPLYAGGRIRYGIESAKYLEQAARLDAGSDREEIILNTIDAYNNLYKAKAAVALVKENLAQARQRVKDFASLEKNGLLARNDYLKAELQASNTELALLDAENNWKLANVNMDLMLGLPDGTEIVPDSASLQSAATVKTLEEYQQLGLQNRKDLSAVALRKKAAHTGIKAAEGEKYPSIALTGGYVALDVPHGLVVTNALNLGVGVQYSISALWKNAAKVQQARAREKQVEAGEELLTDAIRLQVNQAYQHYLLSRKKIEVHATAVAHAAENYKIVRNKHENGLATVTDLLDADVAQLQAKLNQAFAASDATVAYQKLLQAAGLIDNKQ